MNYTTTRAIPPEMYDDAQFHLEKGIEFEGEKEIGTVYAFSSLFPNGIMMDIKVCNAPTEGGGAWVDIVLFEKYGVTDIGNFPKYNEVAVGDVYDTLDTEFELWYNENTYITKIVKGK